MSIALMKKMSKERKGRDLTQSRDKNPYTHRTIHKATWLHKNATKNCDYTTIADRLRTVSWSSNSHPTGVVKPVYERATFQLDTYLKIVKNKMKHFYTTWPYQRTLSFKFV